MRNAQHFAHAAHFILEKILQRLYRAKELYIVRLLDLVMMRLYNGSVALAAFYAVGVYRSLRKEALAIAFAYLVPEYAVKLRADYLALLFGIAYSLQAIIEMLLAVYADKVHVEQLCERLLNHIPFILAHKALIHKYAGELLADGL